MDSARRNGDFACRLVRFRNRRVISIPRGNQRVGPRHCSIWSLCTLSHASVEVEYANADRGRGGWNSSHRPEHAPVQRSQLEKRRRVYETLSRNEQTRNNMPWIDVYRVIYPRGWFYIARTGDRLRPYTQAAGIPHYHASNRLNILCYTKRCIINGHGGRLTANAA